jgi:hypothetical protein
MKRMLVAIGFLAALAGRRAEAAPITIEFEAAALGGNLWQYEYVVSDFTFEPNQGFSVYFDPALFATLQAPAVNGDWDVIAVQADPDIPSDGFFDALALVSHASLVNPFIVTFSWLGAPGTVPGSQPLTVNEFDAQGGLSILERGRTVPASQLPEPIPEPSTLMLVSTAVAGLVQRLRKRQIL